LYTVRGDECRIGFGRPGMIPIDLDGEPTMYFFAGDSECFGRNAV
jgi:hypothetical protein